MRRPHARAGEARIDDVARASLYATDQGLLDG